MEDAAHETSCSSVWRKWSTDALWLSLSQLAANLAGAFVTFDFTHCCQCLCLSVLSVCLSASLLSIYLSTADSAHLQSNSATSLSSM